MGFRAVLRRAVRDLETAFWLRYGTGRPKAAHRPQACLYFHALDDNIETTLTPLRRWIDQRRHNNNPLFPTLCATYLLLPTTTPFLVPHTPIPESRPHLW